MSNKPTVKQYENKLANLTTESYVKKPYTGKGGGKSWGIRWGKLAEPALVDLLKNHPNYQNHDTQVRNTEIDKTSCIDVVFKTKTGKTVYIPVVKDLWKATAQVDRLEKYYYQWKGKFWEGKHVCPLAAKDYKERLSKEFPNAFKENAVNEIIDEMAENNVIHNVETLWDYLNTI